MTKRTVIYLIGTLFLLCLFALLTVCIYQFNLKKMFVLPNKDVLCIKRESSWEVTMSYTYEIKRNKKVIVPLTAFYYHFPNVSQPEFELAYSEDQKMIAVVPINSTKTICILYDMETSESYPYQGLKESLEDYLSRNDRMLNKFNNGKGNYILNEK